MPEKAAIERNLSNNYSVLTCKTQSERGNSF